MTAGGIDETIHDLSVYIKHGILRLQETWNEIGVNDEEQFEKCESVVRSLRSVLDSLVIGERAWRDCLDEECTELSGKCNELFKKLGLPTFDPESVTLALISKRDFLCSKNAELTDEVDRKQQEISDLEDRKIKCIKKLGLQPDHYPSIQSENLGRIISLLEIQIREFEDDMSRRTRSLHQQLDVLVDLVDSLELDRCGLIEEGLISDEPDTLLLSDESIQRRHDMITKYKAQLQANSDEANDLQYSVKRLHRLVHKDKILDPNISDLFGCPKPSSIAALKNALNDLEITKHGKLESYVQGLQDEIKAYQVLCFQTKFEVSRSDSSMLDPRDHDHLKTSSTDTLDLPDIILDHNDIENNAPSSNVLFSNTNSTEEHEMENKKQNSCSKVQQLEDELESWESFYNNNKTIFVMITKWKELNDRYLQLQTPSPDKYNNRGGSLLQSQKESAKIAKEIPRLESKVLTEVDKLDGETIKVNGLNLEDYFLEYRATTCLNRINSLRRSRRSLKTTSKASPGEETQRPDSRPNSRRSMRKRVSREGLDKVGLK